MDESIRNAEKLIAAANTALARMKNDTYNDDFLYIVDGSKDGDKKKSKPMLSLDEESFTSFLDIPKNKLDEYPVFQRKNPNHNNCMDEINSKIEAYKQELFEKGQRKPLEVWQFSRDEQQVNKGRECGISATKTVSDTNLSRKSTTKTGLSNITEDLKTKLLQTQEIVDRGIQTAREISETVDVFKTRPLKTSRFDEVSKSKSSEKLRNSESKSTIKSVDVKKCRKCNSEITTKKSRAPRHEDNVMVTKVQGKDSNPRIYKKLHLQELPSLNIHGDLICQRIPSVDILPGKRECFSVRANTGFETCSHEHILSSRIDKVLNDIKKWNSLTQNIGKKADMECSNCGTVMSARSRLVNSEEIDELLRICNYNVFDPRIDEFVESCRVRKEEVKFTQTEEEPPSEPKKQVSGQEESPVVEERPKITQLSKELTRKYREKAAELESDHLEFESILRDVFEKIDQSRDLFTNCEYLKQMTKGEERKVSLTMTKPVLLSYTGSVEEIDDYNNAVMRPRKQQKHKMSSKDIRRKLEKKELRTNCKVLNSVSPTKESRKEKDVVDIPKYSSYESKEASPVRMTMKDLVVSEREVSAENKKTNEGSDLNIVEEPATGTSEPKQKTDAVYVKLAEDSAKHTNTGSEYESDFEEESFDEVPIEKESDNKSNIGTNRLSTITEVDSDICKNDAVKDTNQVDLAIEMVTLSGDENLTEVKPVQSKTIEHSPNVSDDDDDTEKLLKQVNKDLEEVASLSGKRMNMIKDVPDHVTEPLKQVLDALKNQFERTELLADKLTESIREVQKPEDVSEICRKRDIIYNLQKARKNVDKIQDQTKTDLQDSSRTSSPEEELVSGKSSGELVIPNAGEHNLSPDDLPIPGSVRGFTDKSYSEGEISELEVLGSGRSSPSVGEVRK